MEGKREQEPSGESGEKLFSELVERERKVESILAEIENLIASAGDLTEAEDDRMSLFDAASFGLTFFHFGRKWPEPGQNQESAAA